MSLAFPPSAVKESIICENCQSIDLAQSVNVSSRKAEEKGHFIAIITWLSQTCNFCQVLNSTLRNLGFDLRSPQDDGAYELRAFPLYELDLPGTGLPDDAVRLQLFPPRFPFAEPSDADQPQFITTKPVRVLCRPLVAPKTCFQPLAISPMFNAPLVRKWLETCQNCHEESCLSGPPPADLILIDCIALELRTFQDPPPYLALSYVWAKTGASSPNATRQDCFPPAHGFSAAIQDSISVTKQLGFQYLWVDKYCVNQIDEIVKHRQIDSMDRIYSRAELTIIAASGQDENNGLPGVSFPREPPLVFSVGDFTIIIETDNVEFQSGMSVWAQRGWTFQEDILSRCRLIFLPTQVSFDCSGMQCWEGRGGVDLCANENEQYSISQYADLSWRKYFTDRVVRFSRHQSAREHWKSRMFNMESLVFKYSRRTLTFDSDALRAFAGIQNAFRHGEHKLGFIRGIPIPLHTSCSENDWTRSIGFWLLWEIYRQTPRRRHMFPSWTWAGWAGRIAHMFPGQRDDNEYYLRGVTFGHRDRNETSLHETVQELRQGMRPPSTEKTGPELSIPRFLQPEVISFQTHFAAEECFGFEDEQDWRSGRYFGMPINPDDGTLENGFEQRISFAPSQFLHCLRNTSVACIILALTRLYEVHVHFLIVQCLKSEEGYRIDKFAAKDKLERLPEIEEHVNSLPWARIALR